jgi:transposase
LRLSSFHPAVHRWFFWELRGILNECRKDFGTRDTELCERLLGLKEPWKVKAVRMDVEGRRVEVEVECAERTIWASPESRQRLHIHGWERRSWRHLDTCGFATVITAEVPRVKDEKGQTETVAVQWAEKFSRFTRSFEAFGVEVLRAARSLSEACKLRGVWSAEAWQNSMRWVSMKRVF